MFQHVFKFVSKQISFPTQDVVFQRVSEQLFKQVTFSTTSVCFNVVFKKCSEQVTFPTQKVMLQRSCSKFFLLKNSISRPRSDKSIKDISLCNYTQLEGTSQQLVFTLVPPMRLLRNALYIQANIPCRLAVPSAATSGLTSTLKVY